MLVEGFRQGKVPVVDHIACTRRRRSRGTGGGGHLAAASQREVIVRVQGSAGEGYLGRTTSEIAMLSSTTHPGGNGTHMGTMATISLKRLTDRALGTAPTSLQAPSVGTVAIAPPYYEGPGIRFTGRCHPWSLLPGCSKIGRDSPSAPASLPFSVLGEGRSPPGLTLFNSAVLQVPGGHILREMRSR